MTTNSATGKIKASRVNNLDAATYVGPAGQIWYDVNTGILRLGDNVTAGGTIIGGGGGNGSPGGPNASIQFNNGGLFGGTSNLTTDGSNLTITGNVVPGANNLYNFGSPTLQWASVYISANTLYFDSIPLTAANATALLYNSLPLVSQTANGSINIPGNISAVGNITASGNIVANGFQLPNGQPVTTSQSFVTSNIANLQAGLALNVAAVYGNAQYPGGVFTIYQSANLTPTITVTDSWSSTGTANKDQYLDFANGVINTSNVSITLGLSSSTFSVQSSDHILIGASNITGANLTGLGISGTGGTYTIPAAMIAGTETTASNPVSVSLSTVAANSIGAAGTTLTTTAPIPFSVTSVTPSWTYPTIVGNVGNSQPINWSYVTGTGTVLSGNIIITGNANITQSSNTATSGSTANVLSTLGNFYVQASIQGNGTHGAGTSTSNVSATLAAATVAAGTITITDTWVSTGTANKDQYTDFANSVVNNSNVSMVISLSSGTFNVQSSDHILVGTSNITGANLTGLGISGTGGTYTIPSAMLSAAEIAASNPVSASLTTTGGLLTATGTTLTTTAPVLFSLANVTANFTYDPVVGNVGNSQPINWNVAVSTGTVLSGNIIISGNANITQSANTSLTGSTPNVISTAGNFNVLASYQGNGTHGSGTQTSNVSVVLPAATVGTANLVLYTAVTNAPGPSFTPNAAPSGNQWVDSSFGNTYVLGPGLPGNSYGILTNWNNPVNATYYWMAFPDAIFWGNNLTGFGPYVNEQNSLGIVNLNPQAAFGNGTADFGGSGGQVLINGQQYVALGYNGFANIQGPSNPPNLFLWGSTSSTS